MKTSRDALVLALAVFLVGWGTNVSTPFLVLYRDRLDLGDSATMAIFAVYVIGIMATLPLAGPLSDRFGRRAVAIPGVVLSGLSSLIMIFGRDEFAFLLLGRLALGIVSGAVLGVSAAWLQELMGPGNEQRAAIWSTALTFGGFGIGPPISAAFEAWTSDPLVWPYVLHAVLIVAVIPPLLRVAETHGPERRSRLARVELGVPAASARFFWFAIVPAAVWVFGFPSTSFALFPVLVGDSIPDKDVLVAAASGMLTAWSGLVARPVVLRIGPRLAMLAGVASGAVGYVFGTVAFAADVWPFVLPAAVCLGGGSGMITAGALGLLAEMAEPHNRGALNSTFYLIAYPGMTMPLIVTGLGAGIGLTTAMVLITSLAGAVLIGLSFGLRRTTSIVSSHD